MSILVVLTELIAQIAGHGRLTEMAQPYAELSQKIMDQTLAFSMADGTLTIPAGSIVPFRARSAKYKYYQRMSFLVLITCSLRTFLTPFENRFLYSSVSHRRAS